MASNGRDEGYELASQTFIFNFLLAFPVVSVYTLGLFWMNRDIWSFGNGADRFLSSLLALVSFGSPLLFVWNVIVGLTILAVVVYRSIVRNWSTLRFSYFLKGLAYGSKYALLALATFLPVLYLLGASVGTRSLDQDAFLKILTRGTGAGFYEELLFRVMMAGGLLTIVRKFSLFSEKKNELAVGIYTSAVFSIWHFLPLGAWLFNFKNFLMLSVLGLAFFYVWSRRGFAVAVWTHAIYDILLYFLLW